MKAFTLVFTITMMMCIQDNSGTIFRADAARETSNWFVVNDGVMGGLSKGNVNITDDGNVQFSGYVSTDNNGGFSSIRYHFDPKNVSAFKYVVLHLKGDGKSYQFRIKANKAQRHSYISIFKTSGAWETITIPLHSFYPSFRGYTLNIPNYNGETMEEVAFLIGNKVKEQFNLEIKSVSLKP
ncbi:MAG: CIA30 family protein [Bacteroidota bacterium]